MWAINVSNPFAKIQIKCSAPVITEMQIKTSSHTTDRKQVNTKLTKSDFSCSHQVKVVLLLMPHRHPKPI
jgi:hypothetical protein